jgi:hypothetical protein
MCIRKPPRSLALFLECVGKGPSNSEIIRSIHYWLSLDDNNNNTTTAIKQR